MTYRWTASGRVIPDEVSEGSSMARHVLLETLVRYALRTQPGDPISCLEGIMADARTGLRAITRVWRHNAPAPPLDETALWDEMPYTLIQEARPALIVAPRVRVPRRRPVAADVINVRAWLRSWFADHGGRLDVAEASVALVATGRYGQYALAQQRITSSLANWPGVRRVGRGVYELERAA